MMMRAYYMNELYGLLMQADEIVTEAAWIFNSDGSLEYTEMDPANVACIHSKINCLSMQEDGILMLSVNMTMIRNLFKQLLKDKVLDHEEVRVSFADKKLLFEYQGLKFSINNVEVVSEPRTKVPEEFKGFVSKADIPQEELKFMIDFTYIHAESVVFAIKQGALLLNAESDFTTSELPAKGASVEGPDVKSKFSCDYLKRLRLPGSNVTARLGNDYVLKIEDGKGNYFMLAPRVDND
jgi:hypothetical protein